VPKKKPDNSELIEDADGRFIVTTYSNGDVERLAVVKTKPTRRPRRPYRKIGKDRTRNKRF
jgi:hypothetical protein